eukprot:31263-Pelagococcus_subviridis.AAC.5
MSVMATASFAGTAMPLGRRNARATRRANAFRVRAAHDEEEPEEKADAGFKFDPSSYGDKFDPRTFRRDLSKSDQYNRRFAKDKESAERMAREGIGYSVGASRLDRATISRSLLSLLSLRPVPSRYRSLARAIAPPRLTTAPHRTEPNPNSTDGLVAKMRESGNSYVDAETGVTLKLADAYGFCWGVERAVQMAYEARKQYPDAKLWITNEIIHNPTVNKRLGDMGVNFIEETKDGKDFSGVGNGEVVILPAFGASVHEMKVPAPDAAAAAAADVFWETDEATGKAFFELPCAGHEGRVIGRGGETIKYIENRFSVKLDMKRDRGVVRCAGAPASLPECRRIVTEVIDTGDIKDRPSADNFTLGGAAGMVAQLIAAAAANGTSALGGANDPDLPEHLKGSDPDETVVVDVPCPGQEGRVIGKGGATIKEIERQSGAGMKVEKGSGKCSIHGALARVIVARRAVMDAMNLVQDFRRVLSFPHWSPYDPVRAVNADP